MKYTSNSDLTTAQIYDVFAEEYRSYSEQRIPYISSIDSLIRDNFFEKVDSLVDFGAGDGVRGAKIYEEIKAERLVQVDVSEAMRMRCETLNCAELICHPSDVRLQEYNGQCDLVMALWNVLGHVSTYEERLSVMKAINYLLLPGGFFVFDVNNWHYEGYGKLRSIFRRVKDRFFWKAEDSDVSYEWTINQRRYPATGHLFAPLEVKLLLHETNFEMKKMLAVDYDTGSTSTVMHKGQIFAIAQKKKHGKNLS